MAASRSASFVDLDHPYNELANEPPIKYGMFISSQTAMTLSTTLNLSKLISTPQRLGPNHKLQSPFHGQARARRVVSSTLLPKHSDSALAARPSPARGLFRSLRKPVRSS